MKIFNRILVVIMLVTVSMVSVKDVAASSATTYTSAINRKGYFVITQDAYLPDRTIFELQLDSPEDMIVDEFDNLYIADTKNRRIVVYDPSTNTIIREYTHEDFSSPKGVFLTEDNELYVADSTAGFVDDQGQGDGNGSIFRFSLDGTLIQRYYKPTSVSFEGTAYNPKRIAVDNQDNMYIVGEGVFDGIIQMSDNGEFQGYFTRNNVNLTAKQRLEDLLFSDEQKEQLSDRNPASFSNVYVDKKGIKYTTSIGDGISNIKKHNTDGSSSIDTDYGIDLELVDTYTDSDGIIYAASSTGMIYVFTSDGWFIFAFGTDNSKEDVSGFYSDLTSIAVDSKGTIWTLDADKSFLQSYTATDYSTTIYNALTLYRQGNYEEAVIQWEEVLKLNQLSVLAHNEIGRNLYSVGEYEESMEHFILSGNRFQYSNSFWEVRNVKLQENLPFYLLSFVVIVLGYFSVKLTNKKYAYLDVPVGKVKKFGNIRIVNDILYMFNLIKHPIDSFYYIKKKQKGSYKGASIIFFMFFITYMVFVTSKGFIYQFVEAADLDLNGIILGFFAIFVLFILSNYLVTSINDGEGSLGEIFKGVSYSLLPVITAMILTTILSYYFTFNEVFILQMVYNLGIGWSVILVFIAVQELHNYTIRETVKSFLLTFLFMMIVAVLFAFVQIMGDQLVQFIIGLFKEAIRNVFS